MVSKRNPGQGNKDNKKTTPKNEKQKIPAVSKQKKGRKDTSGTDLRVDPSWPPKPWVKKHRRGKTHFYANPKTSQVYYTEADLERYLAYLAREEAKKAEQLQTKDSDISEKKIESNEISEATMRGERENLERTTHAEDTLEVAVEQFHTKDSDISERKIESNEISEATTRGERENLERTTHAEVTLEIAVEQFQTKDSDISERKIESNEISEATARGERENLKRTAHAEVTPEVPGGASDEIVEMDVIFHIIESREIPEARGDEVLPENAWSDPTSDFFIWADEVLPENAYSDPPSDFSIWADE